MQKNCNGCGYLKGLNQDAGVRLPVAVALRPVRSTIAPADSEQGATMSKTAKPLRFWIMLAAGAFAFTILMFSLTDYLHAYLGHAGPIGLLKAPIIQHKVGELLIAIPLFLTALTLSIWPAERVATNLRGAWPMWGLGAALNLLAWVGYSLPWTDANRLWFALLAVAGLAGPPLLARLITSKARSG